MSHMVPPSLYSSIFYLPYLLPHCLSILSLLLGPQCFALPCLLWLIQTHWFSTPSKWAASGATPTVWCSCLIGWARVLYSKQQPIAAGLTQEPIFKAACDWRQMGLKERMRRKWWCIKEQRRVDRDVRGEGRKVKQRGYEKRGWKPELQTKKQDERKEGIEAKRKWEETKQRKWREKGSGKKRVRRRRNKNRRCSKYGLIVTLSICSISTMK